MIITETKKVCNRCKRPVDSVHWTALYERGKTKRPQLDLCDYCYSEFVIWLKQTPKSAATTEKRETIAEYCKRMKVEAESKFEQAKKALVTYDEPPYINVDNIDFTKHGLLQQKFASYMKTNNLSQKELADRIQVSQATISRIMRADFSSGLNNRTRDRIEIFINKELKTY